MSNTLFELVDEMQDLYQMAIDPECNPEVLEGSIESVMGLIEVKACGYANLLKQLDMEAKQAKQVAEMFTEKAKVRENNIKRMKEALKIAMDRLNKKELPAGAFTIKLQANGGLQPLKIDGEVPQNMTKVVVEPDNDKIREYLKENTCSWAHLEERGKHIVIK